SNDSSTSDSKSPTSSQRCFVGHIELIGCLSFHNPIANKETFSSGRLKKDD
ncbi:14310_t:CDS:1, partial [Dentiscutata heterogama]